MDAVAGELARDEDLLRTVEEGGPAAFRTWRVSGHAVVVGRGVVTEEEVDVAYCARAAIPIVRRSSGGRSVVVGPGTLQYAFALPYTASDELATIAGAKRFCNALLLAGLRTAAEAVLPSVDVSGDLVRDGRKVAGLSLRRRRTAMLLHGTILLHEDLAVIERALRHPRSEPAYRAGRPHRDFLANYGPLDDLALRATVERLLAG